MSWPIKNTETSIDHEDTDYAWSSFDKIVSFVRVFILQCLRIINLLNIIYQREQYLAPCNASILNTNFEDLLLKSKKFKGKSLIFFFITAICNFPVERNGATLVQYF